MRVDLVKTIRAFMKMPHINRGLWHLTNRDLQHKTLFLVFWHLVGFDIQTAFKRTRPSSHAVVAAKGWATVTKKHS